MKVIRQTPLSPQINDNGMALVDGLEIFVAITVLSEERLSYGNNFTPATITGSTKATTTTDYAVQATRNASLPAFINTNWFTFCTSGTSYPDVSGSPPTSVDNIITINSVNPEGVSSHSGIFQELKTLIIGNEYRLTIDLPYSASVGTLDISRIYNVENGDDSGGVILPVITQSEVTSFTLPQSQITLDFTAQTPSDIIFIDYSSSVQPSNSVQISSISVQAKDVYEAPVMVNFPITGRSKILKRRPNSTIPLDEGQPAMDD